MNFKLDNLKLFTEAILKERTLFGGMLAVMLVVFVFSSTVFPNPISKREEASPINVREVATKTVLPTIDDPLVLEAKSAVIYDIENGTILYGKNSESQLPLASLTKLMTALVASNKIKIVNERIATQSETDSNNSKSQIEKLSNLMTMMLTQSSNEAAAGVAVSLTQLEPASSSVNSFVGDMNKTAEVLGLKQTYFLNETGLDIDEGQSGALGSAADMAVLMAEAVRNLPLEFANTRKSATALIDENGKPYVAINTNKDAPSIPGLIASKTGYTDLAGGNLAVIVDIGPSHPVAFVVLGSTKEGRFSDIEKMIGATYEAITNAN